MKEYIEKLSKYGISFSREVFYILFHCIEPKVDSFEDLIAVYEDRKDFIYLKKDYKEFYDYILNYLHSINTNNEMELFTKVLELVDTILLENNKDLQKELEIVISDIIDLIFVKYRLDINKFNNEEDIKNYLLTKIKDEKIVNLLILLLLADTTLSNHDIEDIPEEEIENIIRTLILISVYICKKGEK